MTLDRRALFTARCDAIRAASFSPQEPSNHIGAEVELLVIDDATDRPVPLRDPRRGVIGLLRAHGAQYGWLEIIGAGGISKFEVPGIGLISFEPGGQLEVSTRAFPSVSDLLTAVNSVVVPLRKTLRDQGVRLESIGIDPVNDARDIPLQLPVERYETMTRYFNHRGPFGVRMMRQTAAIQISLDRGARPDARWRLLNDLAPFVVAIFANSPHYRKRASGHRSYRAHCWRMLDATRTGAAAPSDDPAAEYTRFAYAANDMALSADGVETPFDSRERDTPDEAAWQTHLSTLFPEVRPRGHYEVRSCDAIAPELYAAPLVFLAGLAYDPTSATVAAILAEDSRALLRAAGEVGLRDTSIARTARDLFTIALAGARRLGEQYCGGAALEAAEAFFARYTARDRSPADDHVLASEPAPGSPAPVRST